MKSDLLTGWRPHYTQQGDVSIWTSGDGPETLQMHTGFIHDAGLIQEKKASQWRVS